MEIPEGVTRLDLSSLKGSLEFAADSDPDQDKLDLHALSPDELYVHLEGVLRENNFSEFDRLVEELGSNQSLSLLQIIFQDGGLSLEKIERFFTLTDAQKQLFAVKKNK